MVYTYISYLSYFVVYTERYFSLISLRLKFWREIQNRILLSTTLTMIMTRLGVTQYYSVIEEESNQQTWLDRGPIKAADNTLSYFESKMYKNYKTLEMSRFVTNFDF